MGYELHITRARDWLESLEHPISREQWEDVARRHPALREDGAIQWSDIGSQPVFSITGDDDRVASLSWRDARVDVKGDCGGDVQQTILALAQDLDAMLVGDEGELYLAEAYELDTGERIPTRAEAAKPSQRRIRWWQRRQSSQ